jgi:hypothetical protein
MGRSQAALSCRVQVRRTSGIYGKLGHEDCEPYIGSGRRPPPRLRISAWLRWRSVTDRQQGPAQVSADLALIRGQSELSAVPTPIDHCVLVACQVPG